MRYNLSILSLERKKAMGMTLSEKILAKHANKKTVEAGENIWVSIDKLMTHDVCGPGTIGIFKQQFGAKAKVWNKEKLIIIPDHYIFTQDPYALRNLDILRTFAKEQQLCYFYDANSPDYNGVCHVTLAEKGHTIPGEILLGTDSHTCTAGAFGVFATGIGNTDAALVMGTGKLWLKVPATRRFIFNGTFPNHVLGKDIILAIIGELGTDGATYQAMEFSGTAIEQLSMEERMTICNMAIEAGAKVGLIAADATTQTYLKNTTTVSYTQTNTDINASFLSTTRYTASDLQSVVAQPHSPDRVVSAASLCMQVIDQAYIGSCTGGKISDFIHAARIINGNQVKVPTYIVPATVQVDHALDTEKLDNKSLRSIFVNAGCLIGPASCAACLGGPADTFGRTQGTERVISTTNRNFPARMGSQESSVYLASPYTAAASAITGKITDPREFL